MASLEQKFTKALDEAFGKIEAVDRKKEKIWPSNEDIDRAIIEYLAKEELEGIRVHFLIAEISALLGTQRSRVAERIIALKEKELFDFKETKFDFRTMLLINRDKLLEIMSQKVGG